MNDWDQGVFDPDTYAPSDGFASAAFGVATMVVLAALALAILKKSGFRAMIAVGPRG